MDKIQIITLVLGSAGIAAVVSAGMSALIAHFERKARRAELLLKAAMDLADWRLNLAMKNAENLNINITLKDKVVYAEEYYRFLMHLLKHDRLPDDPNIQRFRTDTFAQKDA